MTHWLYPANTKRYDVFGAFGQAETFWPVNSKVAAGDVVYIYLAAPHKQIGFVCDVIEVGIDVDKIIDKVRPFFKGEPSEDGPSKPFMKLTASTAIDVNENSPLAYKRLKDNGLTGMLMGPRKLENNPPLLSYIEGNV